MQKIIEARIKLINNNYDKHADVELYELKETLKQGGKVISATPISVPYFGSGTSLTDKIIYVVEMPEEN